MIDTKLIPVIVDSAGRRRDLAFPEGVTLADALRPLSIGALTPFSISGEALRPGAVIGRDIGAGSLILLRPEGWSGRGEILSIDHSAEVRADTVTLLLHALAIITGSFAAAWVIVGRTPPEPVLLSLAAALAAAAALLACRDTSGRPVLEAVGPACLVVGAAALTSFANPGDYTHQLLIVAMFAIALVSLLRWLRSDDPAVSSVCADMAVAALLVGLLDLGIMALDQPIQLTAAVIFGLCPPLLAAISGFSVRIPSDFLLDQESVMREAPAVRTPPADPEAAAPHVPHLIAVSSARNRLWTVMTCTGLGAAAPTMLRLVDVEGWRGTIALLAVLAALACCLLVPRTSSSRFVRIVPRATAGAIILYAAATGAVRFDPLVVGLVLAGLGLAFTGAALVLRQGRRFYGFSRVGDILQSLCAASSLPLSMAAIGIISLVRSGGLG